MTLRLATAAALYGSSGAANGEPSFRTCALVNNMPDGAFDATERQFVGLIEVASGTTAIEVRRYTMDGIPRGAATSARIAAEYSPFSNIYLEPPDYLIVTGSNPIEVHIQDEPYWADLVELLTWSRTHVESTLLSCLSAHAALTVFDDISRVRLLSKCTGVFPQHVEPGSRLTAGLDQDLLLPHSRWNSVPREALEDVGYKILISGDTTGWSVAERQENGRHLVLVQGHPEYDPSSLLREYRRDAGRYVHRERDDLPFLPYHCVAPEDWGALERMHNDIVNGERDPHLIERYPFDEVGARSPWPWRSMATHLFANWLTSVDEGKD